MHHCWIVLFWDISVSSNLFKSELNIAAAEQLYSKSAEVN